MTEIQKRLFALSDSGYRDFHSRLMPGTDIDTVIGVRVPFVRKLAKELIKEGKADEFIKELPHRYYEENNLHAFIVAEIKDFETLITQVQRFLPFIDNWATCDSFRPKAFNKNAEKLLPYIFSWLKSEEEFTVRFAIEMLMVHFLDERYDEVYPKAVSEIKSDKYYINMMIAWYFATAFAKQRDSISPYIKENRLPEWVHKMTVRKIRESKRTDYDL